MSVVDQQPSVLCEDSIPKLARVMLAAPFEGCGAHKLLSMPAAKSSKSAALWFAALEPGIYHNMKPALSVSMCI